jgi:hypothetical protein
MQHGIIRQLATSAGYVGIGLLLVLALQAGCKRSATVAEPKGGKSANANGRNDEVFGYKSVSGEDVQFAGGKKAVPLPAGFPADVALYPKAMPVMTAVIHKQTRVDLTTAASRQDVEAFYGKKLQQDGWKIDGKIKVPHYLKATKRGRTLSVDISAQSGETTIHLSLVKGK